ncbi:MAG: SBBP repeat-containing protein [Bryobacteraceae bacterium]
MRPACRLFVACLGISLILKSETVAPQVHRLEIADCDDVAFGPEGDLYFACHSPEDRLQIEVRGAKAVPDEMDGYVLRFNPRTGKLIYATRFSGSSFDAALRVKVDSAGFAYATGLTRSRDFPVTEDALQTKLGGGSDAFLVKIAPDGQIAYATLIGGSGDDLGNGLDLDDRGNVYLGGVTSSADFPAQRTPRKSAGADVFVCRFRPAENGASCRVFGGRQEEKLTGIVLDAKRGIYAVGYTRSADFPTKDPVQPALAGTSDLFLTRLSLPALEISFSTFFGGNGDDSGWGIAIDGSGNPVVAGITDSRDLPGTSGGYQRAISGRKDAFFASFQSRHHREVRATYFGGSHDDESGYDGGNIKVDRRGNIWVVGITYSDDLPTRNAPQARFGGGNGNGFVGGFTPDLRNLCFSSYHGGQDRSLLEGLAISPSGTVAATGVSFAEVPSALHIRIGRTTVHAGANVLLFRAEEACPN